MGVNTSDSDFKTPEKTGGSKSHRHSFRIGMHWWYGGACGEGVGNGTGAYVYSESGYNWLGQRFERKIVFVSDVPPCEHFPEGVVVTED